MISLDWHSLMYELAKQVLRLPSRQLAMFKRLLQEGEQQQAERLLQAHFEAAPHCPHCGEARPWRYGHASGLQRWRCRACRSTFNALTGTPLARLRLKDKWLHFLRSMMPGSERSVREAAADMGINKSTSFRWRHRFLSWAGEDQPEALQGITEADEMFFRYSEKGARHLNRAPRKRGKDGKAPQVCVLVARDRSGQTLDAITGLGSVSRQQLLEYLRPHLDADCLLVSDGNASYHAFAQEAGISHKAINVSIGRRVRREGNAAYHVQHVNAYHGRLRQWMVRFHGVATKYLANYLAWFRGLDTHRRDTPQKMLFAAVGAFP